LQKGRGKSEGDKERKIERDEEAVPTPSTAPTLSFVGSSQPPLNPAALHRIRPVSSSPLPSLPHRERGSSEGAKREAFVGASFVAA